MKRTKPGGADQRPNRPTASQIEDELIRVEGKKSFRRVLRSAAYVILVVAAVSVLLSTFLFPVLKVFGTGMQPTVAENEIVVCIKQRRYTPGDVIALYYNNRILLRRVVCVGPAQVNIDEDGNVFVDGALLEEPYLAEKSLTPIDVELPIEVSEGTYFVLADNRASAADSRAEAVGTLTADDIAGKVLFSVWPLQSMRSID